MQSCNQVNGGRWEVSVLGLFNGELLIICPVLYRGGTYNNE